MNEGGKALLYAMDHISPVYIQEAGEEEARRQGRWRYAFATAACLCLALLGTLRLSGLPGCDGDRPPLLPVETDGRPAMTVESEAPAPKVTINWDLVAVNESAGLGPDYARCYYDPELYEQESWGEEEVVDYYGWNLAPAYIPEDLSDGGQGVRAGIYREKATEEIVQEQAGRGFWVDFYEDGGPRSTDDIVQARGFHVVASRKGILHCALLPVDDERVTQFGQTEVTLAHASLPHGPFDPTRKDPSGLYNMPAGYYDIYTAAFEMDGVHYEVEAQRMELEEVIRIVASIISPGEDIVVGVGCGMEK